MLDKNKQNIRPVHKGFVNVESSSTHTTLTPFFSGTVSKGFKGFTNVESSSTHTTYFTSGYQYTGQAGVAHDMGNEPLGIVVDDSLYTQITLHLDEPLAVYEFNNLGTIYLDEQVAFGEECNVKITVSFEEGLVALSDVGASQGYIETDVPIADSISYIWYKIFDEGMGVRDASIDVFMPINRMYTTEISIQPQFLKSYTTCVEVASYIRNTYGTNTALIPYDLADVTVISSESNNPFKPTIIIDGDTIITHTETAP